MNFRTAIDFPGNPGYIDHRQQILLLGSCFAENIGLWLQQRKFNVDINPFGTLYNPFPLPKAGNESSRGKRLLKTNFSLSIIYGTVTITIPDSRGATKRPHYRS